MLHRPIVPLALFVVMVPRPSCAQLRQDVAPEWSVLEEPAQSPAHAVAPGPVEPIAEARRTLRATLLGSVAGAAVTVLYFAARDEDTYECNACVERALVAGLTTATGAGIGARAAGAGLPRSVAASLAGTVVGALIGLALIEPLNAGWPAGMAGYVLGQGITTGIVAHGGVR